MSKKFKTGFIQKIKGRLTKVQFFKLGTRKIVLHLPVEVTIEKPTKPIEIKKEIK
jgi:hypothetical protein